MSSRTSELNGMIPLPWLPSLPVNPFSFFSIPVVLCGLVCPLVLLYGFLSLVESPYDK